MNLEGDRKDSEVTEVLCPLLREGCLMVPGSKFRFP